MTVNVIAVLAGAMFVYLGKFGYMSRHVGMVTVKNVKLTVVQEVLGTAMAILAWYVLVELMLFLLLVIFPFSAHVNSSSNCIITGGCVVLLLLTVTTTMSTLKKAAGLVAS